MTPPPEGQRECAQACLTPPADIYGWLDPLQFTKHVNAHYVFSPTPGRLIVLLPCCTVKETEVQGFAQNHTVSKSLSQA